MEYFKTPDHCVAVNHKVASESVCEALVRTFHPEQVENWDREEDDGFWRSYIEQTDAPDKPTVMLFRDPVERFLSTYGMIVSAGDTSMTVDNLIASLSDHNDPRLAPQIDFVKDSPNIKVFKFPEQVSEFCKYIGIPELPLNNIGKLKKPSLTKAQKDAILSYYQDDYAFYNQL